MNVSSAKKRPDIKNFEGVIKDVIVQAYDGEVMPFVMTEFDINQTIS